jgi:pyridoxal phosphate enzyme (YggS family)
MKAISDLKTNLEFVLEEITERKTVDHVTLVAVSKYSEFDDIKKLYTLGHRDFGENRYQDLHEKAQLAIEAGMNEIRWHFIGGIQSNKIKRIVHIPNLVAIHSVDSASHLREFYKHVTNPLDFFVQFNTSGEEEKAGISTLEDYSELANVISQNKESPFKFIGLMTMGKIRTDDFEKDAKRCFGQLVHLRDEINPKLGLSMGMSRDFSIALEFGATHVRVGSTIFK